ncbi:MAG: hypothetical protein U9R49_16040, partial [Bacteroidota bacterium]|nr:hypothetical protein [Bacteroidota bacterium]
ISFSILGECLEIDGIPYKVGAVIVKGTNAANVYFYKDGEIFDSGLAAPGDKHMVSNLTFCLVPCEDVPQDPEYVIAVKSHLGVNKDDVCTGSGYGVSIGTDYGGYPQYNLFDPLIIPNEYMFYRYSEHIGTITAEIVVVQIDGEDTDCMSIVIETNEGFENYLFNDTYLYFGSLEGLLEGGSGGSFLPYYNFPYIETDDDCAVTREFLINLKTMLLVTE